MPHLLLVGRKFSPLSDYLEENGYEYTLLQDVLTTKFPEKKFRRRIVADFSTKDAYIAALASVKTPIDGVLTVYENYIIPAAIIADYLHLPGLPVSAAEACTDKSVMRSLFDTAPEKISPAFQTVSNEDELVEFAQSHSFPLILKPANLSKSLLVTKNADLEELRQNYRKSVDLLETTYKKYAPNRTPKLIIEEFLEGSIHSVDAFVEADGTVKVLDAIVDYQTGYDIGYDDNFHYSRILPSKLSAQEQSELRRIAAMGVKTLGMKSSAAHIEIIMTKEGPFIVEIGARSGGYRERMHRLANDIDIHDAMIATALGTPVDISIKKRDPCAVLELFPKEPGYFVGISHMETLRTLPSLNYISVKAKIHNFVGKAADGYKMCAVVILHHQDQTQFQKDLDYITEHCRVETSQTSPEVA